MTASGQNSFNNLEFSIAFRVLWNQTLTRRPRMRRRGTLSSDRDVERSHNN